MDSMYLSLLCAMTVFCFTQVPSFRGYFAGHRELQWAAVIYILGLFAYSVEPAFGLYPPCIIVACSLFLAILQREPIPARIRSAFVGLMTAVTTERAMVLFPFHQWHKVPTTVLLAALWILLSAALGRGVKEAHDVISWIYIWMFVFAVIPIYNTTWSSQFLWNMPYRTYALSVCNVYWLGQCGCTTAVLLLMHVEKLWGNRYKPVI